MTEDIKKIMDEASAQNALDADIVNIKQRVNSGKPLTSRQRALIESQAAGLPSVGTYYALNQSALAEALGCTRQRIAYWTKQPDAPQARANGQHDVQAWRQYLAGKGRGIGCGFARHDTAAQQVEDSALAQFIAVSQELPAAMRDALAGVVDPSKLDEITLEIWLRLATAQTLAAGRQGVAGILDGDDTDPPEYPSEIVELCARLSP